MPTSLDDLDVRVYVDYPQDRRNRLGPFLIATDGSHLDDSTAIDCIIDPTTQSVFGMPLPMTPEWRTSATGDYVRLQKSDYTFSSPATASDWLDFDYRVTGDTYLISASSDTAKKSASVKITGGLKKNQPLFLSYSKIDKADQNNQYILKLFWQSTVEFPNYDVGLFFKSDGGADLHRGYVIKSTSITWSTGSTTVTGVGTKFNTAIGSGGDGLQANSKLYTTDGQLIGTVSSIASDTSLTLTSNPKFAGTNQNWFAIKTTADKMKMVKSYSRTEQNFNANKTLKPLSNPNGKFNDVFIIPCRGKDLLVFSSYGLNFCHSFEDLDDPYSPPQLNTNEKFSPVILPKGDFGVVVPTGNCAFQLAKLKFKEVWSISSKPIEFDGGYLQNSQLPFFWENGEDFYSYSQNGTFSINYPGNKIKKTSGDPFDTSWPVGSRLYISSSVIEDLSFSGLVGKINSITSNEITLVENSNYYTNYSIINNTQFNPTLIICKKKTGTISWTTANKTVTGTSTLFNSEVSIGGVLYDDNDRLIGQIKSITSNTSLELFDNPCFSSVSSSVYWQNLPMRKFKDRGFSFEASGPADNTSSGFGWVWDYHDKFGRSLQDNANTSKELILIMSNLTNYGSDKFDTDFLYSSDELHIFNTETLNNTQIDITSAVERLTLGRNQDGAMTGTLSARKKLLTDLSVIKPEILSNRSIKITLKPRTAGYTEVTIFEGFLSEPDIEYIQGSNYDNYALLNFELTDKKQQMNEMFFSVAPSFEDKGVQYIFTRAAELAAINGKDYFGLFNLPLNIIDKKTLIYSFDFNRMNSAGQYNSTTTPSLGDSVGSFLENLRNELFSNYKISIKNKWIFDYFKVKWLNLPILQMEYNYARKSSSDLTLYLNETSANTYGSIPVNKAYKRTIRSMSRTYQRPDANKITVIGIDKSNNNRISVTKTNTNSINPYIAPSNRGNDWMGDTRDFVQISPSLTSLKSVEFAADGYYDRLAKSREIIQFNSDLLTLFDNTTSYPNPEYWKTGVIFYDTSTSTVTGNVATLFTEQVAVNDKLYANGTTLIGTINSITDNDTLVLNANSAISGNTVKWTNKILSGTITSLTNSSTVNGVGTSFTTQLAVDDFLYHPSTGELIGKVFFITNDTSLVLYTDAYIAVTSSLFTKTKPYLFLEQFKFLDNADVVTIKDTTNATIGNYIINSWNCEFVKDYTSASSDEIVIRNCNYQCQKTDLVENVPVYPISEFNEDSDNVNNVIVGEQTTINLLFDCEKYLTPSLITAPSGMTVTLKDERINEKDNLYVVQLQWTPTSTQQNYIHNVELQLTPTGQSAVSFFYKFRVFSS